MQWAGRRWISVENLWYVRNEHSMGYPHAHAARDGKVKSTGCPHGVRLQNQVSLPTDIPEDREILEFSDGHYVVSVANATPILDFDNDGDLEADDRQIVLATGSIAPEPMALIPEGSDPVILIGPETPVTNLDFGNMSVRTYWYQTYETIP